MRILLSSSESESSAAAANKQTTMMSPVATSRALQRAAATCWVLQRAPQCTWHRGCARRVRHRVATAPHWTLARCNAYHWFATPVRLHGAPGGTVRSEKCSRFTSTPQIVSASASPLNPSAPNLTRACVRVCVCACVRVCVRGRCSVCACALQRARARARGRACYVHVRVCVRGACAHHLALLLASSPSAPACARRGVCACVCACACASVRLCV